MRYFLLTCLFFISLNSSAATDPDPIELFKNGIVFRSDSSDLLKATVPGSIYFDLLSNKRIQDPFFSDNETKVKWVENVEWIYVDTFLLSAEKLNSQHIDLILEGIDTYAEVVLNDSSIAFCDNMFLEYSIDIKKYCRQRNILKIHIKPIKQLTDSLSAKVPYKLPGGDRVFVRKAAFNFGWDFAPDLRAGGICKPVKVVFRNSPKLMDIHFIQKQISPEIVNGRFEIKILSDEKRELQLNLISNKAHLELSKKINIDQGENKVQVDFEVENPLLWTCNGHGKVNLYDFQISIGKKDSLFDKKDLNLGFRTLDLMREKDKIGESFYFKLNAEKIFCKGANVVPPEYFTGIASDSSWIALVNRAADMNMNMLRVWGGGVYPPKAFYDACDQKGILVWQDFMFACSMVPGDSAFQSSVEKEAKKVILKYRNHPSLALWCGNNESIEGWYNWGWQKEFKYSAADSLRIISDYSALFEKILPQTVEALDAKTNYWSSSPEFGWGRKESMLRGDSHYWGVWWGMEPFEKYKEKIPRFMSEYGFQSLPIALSVSKFMGGGNFTLSTPALKSHQKHPTGFETISKYMDTYYIPAKDFRSQTYLSNILQAKGMHVAITAHRSAMPVCMGSLIWQLNDCWPGISWSLFDYYGREKAAYYNVRTDFKNVILGSELKERNLFVKLISDSINVFNADLSVRLIDFDGNIRWTDKIDVVVNPGTSKLVYNRDLKFLNRLIEERSSMIVTELSYEGKILYRVFNYFTDEKNLILKRPSVSMKRLDVNGNITRFEISLNSFAKNVELSVMNETGGFSDNYFDMIPNTKYIIEYYSAEPLKPNQGLNIRSLIDSY